MAADEARLYELSDLVVTASEADRALFALPDDRIRTLHFAHRPLSLSLDASLSPPPFAARSGMVFVADDIGAAVSLQWFFERVFPDLAPYVAAPVSLLAHVCMAAASGCSLSPYLWW